MSEDFRLFLPIRWAFHCFLTPPSKRWAFKAWKSYLLSFKINPLEIFIDIKTNDYFFQDVVQFLIFNKARTLIDFICFVKKLYSQYEEGYIEIINGFGESERIKIR